MTLCHISQFLLISNFCWTDLLGVKYCNGLSKYWVSRSFELRQCVCSRTTSWVTDTRPASPAVVIRECLLATLANHFFDMYVFLKNLGPKQIHPTFNLDWWSKSEFDLRTWRLQFIGIYLRVDTASQPTRTTLPRKPQLSSSLFS
jgi:hypothetical protein